MSTREFAGHPVVVLFWAAGHPASVEALESMAARSEAEEAGAVFLGVALDADTAAAESAADELAGGDAWEHVLNADADAGETVDTRFYDEPYGIPAVWLLDGEGRIRWTGPPEDLAGPLAEALAAAPPAAPWGPDVRAARVAWARALDAVPGDAATLLDAAATLDGLGALDPSVAAADPMGRDTAARIVDGLGGQPGTDRASLELARQSRPGEAASLDRLLALAGEEANAAAAARSGRVQLLEHAQREADRGNDAAAMALYAELVEGGPEDAPSVLAAVGPLEEFRAAGMDADAAKAEADAAEAVRMLQLARNYARGYQEDKAIELLDELLTRFPDSPSREDAEQLKTQLE